LHQYLHDGLSRDEGWKSGDIYLAGPEAATAVAERFFLGLGMPKSRVFVEAVK